jgi:tRNA1(Val) A37 N6-methylase TrmN6
METSTAEEKKQLGIYYTPNEATHILAEWAIRSASDYVLEPSFGNCGFLQAVVHGLAKHGCSSPIDQVYGFDISEAAFSGPYERIVRNNGAEKQFLKADFLNSSPTEFDDQRFDVVIGNPPYVSYHNMGKDQRESVANVLSKSEFSLDRKASLWAYFVLHALEFLKEGGRMAWVLPGSFFHADYATSVSDLISRKFQRGAAFQLGERIFRDENAEESTVILLAEGHGAADTNDSIEVGHVSTLRELSEAISKWERGEWTRGKDYNDRIGNVLTGRDAMEAMKRVEEYCNVVKLKDLAQAKIGIVTGANRFFIVSDELVNDHKLEDSDWKYIFSKSKITEGISVTNADLKSARDTNVRCMLIHTESECSDSLKEYLDQWSREEISENVTFGKRDPWHQPNDGCIPDAFFPYMQHRGPRIILNRANLNSTNTIHRLYFKKPISEIQKRAIAVSTLSSYTQLSAEQEGRTYGSGVLKHELSEVRSIQLILPIGLQEKKIEDVFELTDKLLRENKEEEAQREADEFVFASLPQQHRHSVVRSLSNELDKARKRRKVTKP